MSWLPTSARRIAVAHLGIATRVKTETAKELGDRPPLLEGWRGLRARRFFEQRQRSVRIDGSQRERHGREPLLAEHDAPGPLGGVAGFVGETEGLVGARREQRRVGEAVELGPDRPIDETFCVSGRDGESVLLDGAFGVAAEGHVVGGEAGDRLDGWWVSGERSVFGGLFGVLGDPQVADPGLHPVEQRVHGLSRW